MEGVLWWVGNGAQDMGSGSEEEEPTLYEELREERTTVDFEQRRQTWRQGA